ncbi:MAG: response regulator [candidate division Zixibacteria bacterium]|nr:response regulator [candidate division Zixibacteria bacterium]
MSPFKLLLVDDSPNILKALVRTLKPEGYLTFGAESAQKAMEILEIEKVDLIITDENMPGLTGTELLRVVRERYPDIIRFMITGANDIEVAKNAINQGEIYRFFTKPWDDFELIVSVRYALQHKITERENKQLKSIIKGQEELLCELEEEHPGITERRLAQDGSIIIDG